MHLQFRCRVQTLPLLTHMHSQQKPNNTFSFIAFPPPASLCPTHRSDLLNSFLLWPLSYFLFVSFSSLYTAKLFFYGATAPWGPRPPQCSRLHDHTWDTPHSVGLLWTSDQPEAETSTWQHTTLTRDRQSCPRRDSNPQSQQAIGRRPTP